MAGLLLKEVKLRGLATNRREEAALTDAPKGGKEASPGTRTQSKARSSGGNSVEARAAARTLARSVALAD